MGWLAAFHAHHDHGSDRFGFDAHGMFLPPGPSRFPEVVVCDHCNAADAASKRKLGLPREFSFAPHEIAQFVTATPRTGHVIDYEIAQAIYDRATAR